MRVQKRHGDALIEPPGQAGKRERLGCTANILARVFKRSPRSVEGFLAGPEVLCHADGWNTRYGDGAAGNTAATVNDLEPITVGNRVALRFVYFYQNIFLRLGGDGSPGIDFRPVEDA